MKIWISACFVCESNFKPSLKNIQCQKDFLKTFPNKGALKGINEWLSADATPILAILHCNFCKGLAKMHIEILHHLNNKTGLPINMKKQSYVFFIESQKHKFIIRICKILVTVCFFEYMYCMSQKVDERAIIEKVYKSKNFCYIETFRNFNEMTHNRFVVSFKIHSQFLTKIACCQQSNKIFKPVYFLFVTTFLWIFAVIRQKFVDQIPCS